MAIKENVMPIVYEITSFLTSPGFMILSFICCGASYVTGFQKNSYQLALVGFLEAISKGLCLISDENRSEKTLDGSKDEIISNSKFNSIDVINNNPMIYMTAKDLIKRKNFLNMMDYIENIPSDFFSELRLGEGYSKRHFKEVITEAIDRFSSTNKAFKFAKGKAFYESGYKSGEK